MVTVEPGIYFNAVLLNPAFKDKQYSKLLNKQRIEQYMSMGGVRLEDDVVVTPDGSPSDVAHVIKTGYSILCQWLITLYTSLHRKLASG